MLSYHRDAEEAAQDIFVKAYLKLHNFKGKSSFSTWLYRITANHCLDILRKRNRRKTESLDALMESQGNSIHKLFMQPASAELQSENRELIQKILSLIDLEKQQVLILSACGLEYQEISEVLECSLDAAKGRLARARKELRDKLTKMNKNLDLSEVEWGENKKMWRNVEDINFDFVTDQI
jgi:RNA polymerase sigma-70 factor (ECF subfamily)